MQMHVLGLLLSFVLILLALVDAFETILQPRRVTHRFRFARFYYHYTWLLWRGVALSLASGKRREGFLSLFGPLSLLGLFASWVTILIVGFGLLHWSLQSPTRSMDHVAPDLLAYFYLSGTTFFTLGYGDMTPTAPPGRALAVVESGLGFAFLAVIISYLPVLYQAYSRREVAISLLDARAGSPPSAGQFLLRLARSGKIDSANSYLIEWEQWAAELLESHLSFPVLSYYRSQHDNQSWLAALTTMLDASALLIAEVDRPDSYQAQLTLAMARHAAVDIALVLKVPPLAPKQNRLAPEQRQQMRQMLRDTGLKLHEHDDAKLTELRGIYEPFLSGLAQRFLLTLPPVMPQQYTADNWQRSAWMQRTPGIGALPGAADANDHFD